jgi:hypothetical protein
MHLLVGLCALITPVDGLTPEELDAALRGEVPSRIESYTNRNGKDAGRGFGAIVIERPIADVWATLTRFEDRADYIPRLEKITVLERKDGAVRLHQDIDASVTTAHFTAWYRLDEVEHRVHWTLDPTAKDNTVAEVDGEYHAVALEPRRTLLVYRSYVDSGRAVPGFVQRYVAKRAVPDLLHALKKRVESGGTWKKD